ncbi:MULTISPECIES: type II/IV secretion system ATPase subunit [Salinibaculum]|uniref:type II/IV secretion system ATPase subunit n=1 Tax=Salinibaculum TaxID=2732368 RepID=UPI0030CC13AD
MRDDNSRVKVAAVADEDDRFETAGERRAAGETAVARGLERDSLSTTHIGPVYEPHDDGVTDIADNLPVRSEETAIVPWEHPTPREVTETVRGYFDSGDHDSEFAPAPSEEFIENQFFDFGYLQEYEEVEHHWVNAPFAYVSVLYDEDANEHIYHVTEPHLDWFERYVHRDLVTKLRNSLMYRDIDVSDRERMSDVFESEAKEVIKNHAGAVDDGSIHKLLYYLLRDFIRFGPIDPLMRDSPIEDISCDGHDLPVFVYHREHRDLPTNIVFDRGRLDSYAFRLAQQAGKQLTISNPMVDATLPGGSRMQLTLGGEVSTRGSNFTIRKFSDIPFTPVDLIRTNTFSVEQMAYFWLAIQNNRSLVFAGGTGSGKTSSMNAVSFFIPPNSKIVSIEDTREVDLPHRNWIQSVTRGKVSAEGQGEIGMYHLLQAALRQRPEYIVVGEIRTDERVALTFFQALSTGHTAYTTFHADSPETVLTRLNNKPLNVPMQMLADLDIISVQRQAHLDDERVRRNQVVAEIGDAGDDDTLQTRQIFRRDAKSDSYERVADSGVLAEIADEWGWSDEDLREQLDQRRAVLRYLVDNDITSYTAVANAIQQFYRKREDLLAAIRAGTLTEADLLEGQQYDIDTLTPSDLGVGDLVGEGDGSAR